MKRSVFCALGCGLILTAAANSTYAEAPAADAAISANKEDVAAANFQRQLDQYQYNSRVHVNDQIPPDQRVLVDYGAYLTFNFLSAQDPSNNTHVLRETDLVGYAHVNLDNVQEVFFRGRISYHDYDPGDSFGGGIEGTGQHTSVEEAYYRFDLQKYLSAYKGIATNDDASVQLGRQTVIWGDGLVFNQDIDGGVMDLVKGPFSFEGVAGVSAPDTIDFDTSRPGFNDRTTRGFFGALLNYQVGQNKPYLYFLSQRDFNSSRPLLTPVPAVTTNYDYNSDYIGLGSTGSLGDRLAYGVEGTVELGNTLSNSYDPNNNDAQITQKRESIEAFAADYRLDYVFPDEHDTRASAEFIMASGDHDRVNSTNDTFGGVRPGTRDLAFNGFGLLNTGLAFAPEVSNVLITRFGMSTQPFNEHPLFRKLEVGGDVFFFNKYLRSAPIDEPTNDEGGRYLGWEPDIFMNWQITSDLTLATRYGAFFAADDAFANNGNPGSNKIRQFFFTGVTLAF